MAPSVKKKSRFETLDLSASLRELQLLLGSKVVNIYDAGGGSAQGGSFVFKLAGGSAPQADGAPSMSKHHLLVDPTRIHVTAHFATASSSAGGGAAVPPSGFCMKLRKHLRGARLTAASAPGARADRVACLRFGSGDGACHVLCE
eukprot:CAMPEP_0194318218 /NCGR_PEP_ID=MMETSP0171-20130528/14853_1 /TAXON_ID=218684 /ORGANISM="Corethron pennatum, Strain L29A3" /LENGTH=144 /DNA_ID=CAMNT_0039075059 /DNA_START=24 /DNA_END=455 /DNA_ORIENTATION=+